jgi:hypothetical protein
VVSRKVKLRIEAPVNGGRNYNGPKVDLNAALEKFGYMLESLSILSYEGEVGKSGFHPCHLWFISHGLNGSPRENAKVQIISRKDQRELESSETTRQTLRER